MTRRRRLLNFITGVFILLVGIALMIGPGGGLGLIAFVLTVTFFFRGLKTLIYYFTMARFSVGGKMMLYIGMIYLDLAVLTSAMSNNSKMYIIIYLMIIHLFTVVVDIMRGIEDKRLKAPSWKYNIAYGAANLLIVGAVFIGGVFRHSENMVIYVYAAGLIYSACIRIGGAFRKQAIVYIQ